MYSKVINKSIKLIMVASVFVFSGCGGGGKTPVTDEPSTNTNTPSTDIPSVDQPSTNTDTPTASSTLTASNYSVMLAVNKASSNSDWFVRSKALDTEGDALSATITTQGKYGTFTITNHGLSYLKTTESKEIDTGVLSISDGTHTVSITVGVHTPEWKQLSVRNHTAVINGDGTLWAWGKNDHGQLGDGTTIDKSQPTQEGTMSNDWKSVVAGPHHTVAMKNDGTLWAWGDNRYGQLGDVSKENKLIPTQESTKANDWKSALARNGYTVALKNDRSLWSWGINNLGQLGDGTTEHKLVPTQESTKANNWESVMVSYTHSYTVAIKDDGTLWSWGFNRDGQLGEGTVENKLVPTQESTKTNNWKSVMAGYGYTVALKHDGTLWTWGNNDYGHLGDGTTEHKSVPIQESTLSTNWMNVETGSHHTVAIQSDGSLWAWGRNHSGQLGDGTIKDKLVPTQEHTLATNWKSAVSGYWDTVAFKNDGTLWAWGNNQYGQLGDGTTTDKLVPTQESTKSNDWQSIEVETYHTLALKNDGTLWAWGYNKDGQLGNGETLAKTVPMQESSIDTDWKSVSVSNKHTVALKNDGTLWSWGNNDYGKLGDGTTSTKSVPVQESTKSTNWESAVVGSTYTIAIKNDGTLWSWGSNNSKLVPTQESTESTNWKSIRVGYNHVVAIKDDGTLWSWGLNYKGQLGDGTTTTEVLVPIQESSKSTNWKSVSAGENYTMAIKDNGTLWGWGLNDYGQLGQGNKSNTSTPKQESTLSTNWQSIETGSEHTVALKSDGTLWAWGYNKFGQLGDGLRSNKSIPTQESTKSTNWQSVKIGDSHTVALKSDGTLWAWGENTYGQLGNGNTSIKSTPTQESTLSTNWQSIEAGDRHTMAFKNDGTLWSWGHNYKGLLGDGTTNNKSIPTQESSISTEWQSITVRNFHVSAIKNDGTLWGWGSNDYGQLTGWTITPTLSQPRE